MVNKALAWTAIAVAAAGSATISLPAQTSSACGVTAMGASLYGPYPHTNAPFSATVETTHQQKLVNGTNISGQAITHQARDSEGRTRNEMSMGCTIGPDGQPQSALRVEIQDPVNHTIMEWTVGGQQPKVVRILHTPEPKPVPVRTGQPRMAPTQPHRPPTIHNEKLDDRIIDGITTEGSRSVRTIPTGFEGNDQPIDVVTELWIARDLGLIMLETTDDPVNGQTRVEVTDLKQGEPDPSLFQPPPDYKLEEQITQPAVGGQ
ncbi:MAG TPA: hypothetical protein VG714_00925 [Acidobacteriaceae bacterium]|nr:hypothetical protein [Acidobacteriaceae bacterium]